MQLMKSDLVIFENAISVIDFQFIKEYVRYENPSFSQDRGISNRFNVEDW